ncbi:MAG: hypothetical protein Q4A29_05015 [Eubacteriales bacterium]|nr:hypothetical protein [Eubacteriales bacterium]
MRKAQKKQCPIKKLGIKGLEYILASAILFLFPIIAHKIASKLYKSSNRGCPVCKLWRK